MVNAPAPKPKPTPFGPNFLPWHCLQKSSAPCSATVHESRSLLQRPENEKKGASEEFGAKES